MDLIIKANIKMEKIVFGEDGQGGMCGEIVKLKTQQSNWQGRDGAIVAGITIGVSIITGFAIKLLVH